MKVLYISNYSEGTGYSNAALNYIQCMDSVGIDIVPKRLRLMQNEFPIPQKVEELEKKSSLGADVVIQHTLPHFMEYKRGFKNIGMFAYETNTVKYNGWLKYLNIMDEVWVINNQMKKMLKDDGFKKPIKVIPHTFDLSNRQTPEFLPALKNFKDNDSFLFYTIGELSRRKNNGTLIRAFMTEFHENENVKLVIKTNKTGLTSAQVLEETKQMITGIKDGLKFNRNKANCVLMTEFISEEAIASVHYTCDCFVQASSGEAWSIPAFQALSYEKTPIVTGWSGYCDYINNECGWLVDYKLEPCFGAIDTFKHLYSGKELWASIDVMHLRKCMRECFENKELRQFKRNACEKYAKLFDYPNIGLLIKKALNEELATD